MGQKTIHIRKATGVTICGNGCCQDDGLMIDVLVNGKTDHDLFYNTESDLETTRVVELLEELYGTDNVKYRA